MFIKQALLPYQNDSLKWVSVLSFLKHRILWWLALCLRVLCNLSETSNQEVLCSPTLEQPASVWGNWVLLLTPTLLSVTFNWWWEISHGRNIYLRNHRNSQIRSSLQPQSPIHKHVPMHHCQMNSTAMEPVKKIPHKEYVFSSTLYSPCSLQCAGHGHWNSIREI